MASLLDKVKAAVDSGTLKPANYNDAIFASRNDPEVRAYLESITPSSPVALFDTAAKGSGYPDLRDRTSPLGSITRVATGETPIFNPYLFNGVTRPTSEATKQVDMQNRNATIQKQNQAMTDAVTSLIPKFSGRGLPPASAGIYSGVSFDNPSPNLPQIPDRFTKTDGRGLPTSNMYSGVSFDNPTADLASLLPMIQGRSPSMVGQGIQSTVSPDGGPSFTDKALASMGSLRMPSFAIPDITLPERFTKGDDRGLPSDPLNRSNPFKDDPIIQGISGAIDTLNANQAEGFKDWLKTPAGRSYTLANAQNELRREIPSTPLGKRLADPTELSELIADQEDLSADQQAVAKEARQPPTAVPPVAEKTEDLTPEAKTFNTAATVVSPEGAEDKQNWFNAVNDRIDLMAMGAAMLAGSGQRGATTMSRLGEGLQAGLASRAAQAKAAEDKRYTDALLVLKAMEQRRLSAKDRSIPALSYANQVDSLESLIRNQGGEGKNVSDLARNILIRDPQFGLRTPQEQVKAVRDAVTATSGLIYGGDLNTAKFSVVPPQQVAK